MNCWEILALQPGAEERDIKRRYAQLVKNCRPEDDPAAWQQLHDAYEQALRYDDEDQWQEEEEEQPINMSRGIVHPRPVMTFRAPNTFSGHPLPDVTIKSEGEFTWRAVLDMLCEENEATPEHAPMQLAKALSFLEKKDLSSRMCFEETLLLHLHRVFRPLLTLAAAQTFRWHLVAGSRQPVIQTEINESCLLYYRIEKQITPFFASNLSPLEEMENGKEMATIYQSLKDNEESLKWFDIAVLNKVAEFELSDNYMALLIECLSYSLRKEKMIRKWKLTERFNNLAMQHHSGYKKLLNAIKLKGLFYYPSSVYQSCLHAAEQGYSLAWYSLGKMYYEGDEVSQDLKLAFNWFTRAAQHNVIDALYALGIMYSDGRGTIRIFVRHENGFYLLPKMATHLRNMSLPVSHALLLSHYEIMKKHCSGIYLPPHKDMRLPSMSWDKCIYKGLAWSAMRFRPIVGFCNQQNRDIYMRNIILPGCIAEVRVFHRTRKKRCTGLPKQQKMGQMGQGMPCMNWGNII